MDAFIHKKIRKETPKNKTETMCLTTDMWTSKYRRQLLFEAIIGSQKK